MALNSCAGLPPPRSGLSSLHTILGWSFATGVCRSTPCLVSTPDVHLESTRTTRTALATRATVTPPLAHPAATIPQRYKALLLRQSMHRGIWYSSRRTASALESAQSSYNFRVTHADLATARTSAPLAPKLPSPPQDPVPLTPSSPATTTAAICLAPPPLAFDPAPIQISSCASHRYVLEVSPTPLATRDPPARGFTASHRAVSSTSSP